MLTFWLRFEIFKPTEASSSTLRSGLMGVGEGNTAKFLLEAYQEKALPTI